MYADSVLLTNVIYKNKIEKIMSFRHENENIFKNNYRLSAFQLEIQTDRFIRVINIF